MVYIACMAYVLPPTRVQKWTRLSRETIASFRVFAIVKEKMQTPRASRSFEYYRLDSPDWCNVIALTSSDELVMVRQYRVGNDSISLEIPGGVVDEDEAPADGARRELREETGYVARNLEPLITLAANPAIQQNRVHSFIARDVVLEGPPAGDADEDCELVLVPRGHLREMLDAGIISHALMVAALQAFLLREMK